jgi:DNA-binding CsgD family transcriptional regulator
VLHSRRRYLSEPLNLASPPGLRVASLNLYSDQLVVLSYPVAAPPIAGLSRAESEVLRAAVSGLSNAEIAALRKRSVFTVQNQLSSACRKLGVASRSEAAVLLAALEHES